MVRATSKYLTVRYGWLSKFELVVPEDAEVETVGIGRRSYYCVKTTNTIKYFKIFHGDAETLDFGCEISRYEIPIIMKKEVRKK
ncbi:MAG: hypothetical protein QXO40_05785 [Candidatus Aenigmatarchaeota archaeon]